ncbi:DUF3828 domain-containing protein [Novosphingobium rosa]|uniref:DUF3828 domain-containing protein n=1 Tax=Novosphingobium rosa TaxID=76978 RepID=UPI000829D4E2|nr:DUF3828 domain-containing protein [Novosphingobium rosa]
MSVATFASLLLAAGSPGLGDARALDALVNQIYAPYRINGRDSDYLKAGIYTSQTRMLIQQWAQQSNGEADEVSDADMLCDCQDWDADAFHVETVSRQFTGPGRAVMLLSVWQTRSHHSNVRLSLVKEGSSWAVEDIGDIGGGTSLRAALGRAMSRKVRR